MPRSIFGTRVLVIDDNSTSRQILKEMLEAMSFEVTLATSAREGLAKLTTADASDPFQLVLMDWEMPELDGLTAARIIREATSLQQPKLILITAYGSELMSNQAEQAGLVGVLVKPISNSSLFNTIMRAFITGAQKLTPSHVLPTVNGLWILLVSVCCWLKITRSIGSSRASCCAMWESSFQRKMAAKRGEGHNRILRWCIDGHPDA